MSDSESALGPDHGGDGVDDAGDDARDLLTPDIDFAPLDRAWWAKALPGHWVLVGFVNRQGALFRVQDRPVYVPGEVAEWLVKTANVRSDTAPAAPLRGALTGLAGAG